MNYENAQLHSGIYQIRNIATGDFYIGSSVNMRTRAMKHLSLLNKSKHPNRHLQGAYIKYTPENFVFEPLFRCSKEDLIYYEQRAMDILNPTYNHARIAGNTLGIKCSEEKARKISRAHKGKKLSEEHRAAIAKGNTGRKPTKETLKKLKKAARQKADDPEWRRKVSEGRKGIACSEEHRKKISRAKSGVRANISKEALALRNKKIGEANKTRPISDKFRKNASLAQKTSSRVKRYLYKGEQRTLLELSESSGLTKTAIRHRMKVLGWSVEKAVDTPSRKKK